MKFMLLRFKCCCCVSNVAVVFLLVCLDVDDKNDACLTMIHEIIIIKHEPFLDLQTHFGGNNIEVENVYNEGRTRVRKNKERNLLFLVLRRITAMNTKK